MRFTASPSLGTPGLLPGNGETLVGDDAGIGWESGNRTEFSEARGDNEEAMRNSYLIDSDTRRGPIRLPSVHRLCRRVRILVMRDHDRVVACARGGGELGKRG